MCYNQCKPEQETCPSCIKPPESDGGVRLGHLCKIFPGGQWMAKVPNGVETVPKISTG